MPSLSPEALAADRERDRLRKQNVRVAERAANPPALPPALPGVAAPSAGAPPPVAGDQMPGLALPPVPWDAEPLRELAGELVGLGEAAAVARNTTKAVSAGMPKELLKEIEKNSRWNPALKVTIAKTAPPEFCKAMESAGISGQYQNLTVLALSVACLAVGIVRNGNETERLIAEFKAAGGKPAEAKK